MWLCHVEPFCCRFFLLGLIRVGALAGSLMLPAATLVALVNQRSEQFSEQDARMQSAATPEELLVTFDPLAEACVGTPCSGPNRAAPSTFGSATSKRLPSVAGVDRASSAGLADRSQFDQPRSSTWWAAGAAMSLSSSSLGSSRPAQCVTAPSETLRR
jgi:hypothetical protein